MQLQLWIGGPIADGIVYLPVESDTHVYFMGDFSYQTYIYDDPTINLSLSELIPCAVTSACVNIVNNIGNIDIQKVEGDEKAYCELEFSLIHLSRDFGCFTHDFEKFVVSYENIFDDKRVKTTIRKISFEKNKLDVMRDLYKKIVNAIDFTSNS